MSSKTIEQIDIAIEIGDFVASEGVMNLPDDVYYREAQRVGLSEEDLRSVHDFDRQYASQATAVAGQHALPVLKADPDMVSVDYQIHQGPDFELDVRVHRSRTFPGMAGGDPVTKMGSTSARVSHPDTARELKKATQAIAEMAANFFD